MALAGPVGELSRYKIQECTRTYILGEFDACFEGP